VATATGNTAKAKVHKKNAEDHAAPSEPPITIGQTAMANADTIQATTANIPAHPATERCEPRLVMGALCSPTTHEVNGDR
jgi:hypothetical protein